MSDSKTRNEWWLMVNYGFGHGWEHETTETSEKEGKDRLKEYRANAPQYQYRLDKKRVKR